MYKIEQKQEEYVNYYLSDTDANTICVITPEKGGMCTSFIVNGKETIYINEENYFSAMRTRCAFPVLFPTLGVCEDDTLIIDNKTYPMGIHGIAHAQTWEVVRTSTENQASITIRLCANEATLQSYPYHFQYDLTYCLKGNTLTLDVHIVNQEDKDMVFSFGFHPYFKISDVRNLEFNIPAKQVQVKNGGFECCDHVAFPYAPETKVTLTGISSPCSFIDRASGKEIKMEFDEDINYVILWSLCEQNFICMEPWNTLPNDLNKGKGIHIFPKGEYKTSVTFTVSE